MKKQQFSQEAKGVILRVIVVFLISAALMFVLPLLALRLIGGDEGFVVYMFLQYFVDPVFAVILGIYSGRTVRLRWFLPLIPPLVYLNATAIMVDFLTLAHYEAAGLYLLCGYMAMGLSFLMSVYKKRP